MLKIKITIFSLFLITFFYSISFSSIIKEISLNELCLSSTDIIIAKVISLKSYYSDSKKTTVLSNIKIITENVIKGEHSKGDILELTYVGGKVDDIAVIVLGFPCFKLNETSLLFMRKFGNKLVVNGESQGKFNISDKDGEQYIYRDNIDFPLKINNIGDSILVTSKRSYKFNDLINEINKILEASK